MSTEPWNLSVWYCYQQKYFFACLHIHLGENAIFQINLV